MLTSVIFGLGANDETIEFVKKLVDESQSDPELRICHYIEDSYNLGIKPLSDHRRIRPLTSIFRERMKNENRNH